MNIGKGLHVIDDVVDLSSSCWRLQLPLQLEPSRALGCEVRKQAIILNEFDAFLYFAAFSRYYVKLKLGRKEFEDNASLEYTSLAILFGSQSNWTGMEIFEFQVNSSFIRCHLSK